MKSNHTPSGCLRVAVAVVALLAAWIGPATAQNRPGSGPPPAPPCHDADGDGRCSPIEVVRSAQRIFGPREAQIVEAHRHLGERAEYLPVTRDLADAQSLLTTAATQLEAGAICDAATSYRSARTSLRQAGDDLAGAVQSLEVALRQAPASGDQGDVTEPDMRSAFLELREYLVQKSLDRAGDAQPVLDEACGAVGRPVRRRRRVVQVDDAAGTFRLDDGTVVGRTAGVTGSGLVAGSRVRITGLSLTDGTILATGVDGHTRYTTKPSDIGCLRLRVAPVQPLSPANPQPFVIHPLDGYRDSSGALELEQGMRLAVEAGGCPASTSSGRALIYSMEISVSQGYPTTIATDLEDGDAAILLSDFIQNSFATLTWKVFRRSCKIFTGLMACQAPVQLETGTESLWMAPLGDYSQAVYDTTTVGVAENGIDGDWERVKVTGVTTSAALGGVPVTFAAQGYGVNGTTSTFPQVVDLALNTPFAVYETDFYNPFYYDPVEQMEVTGQETPSGLRWAHVSGTRNGAPFRYTTALPKMVHDRIARCPVAAGFTEPMGPARIPTPDDPDVNWPPRDGPFNVMAVGDSFYKIPFRTGFAPGLGDVNIDDANPARRHPTWQAYAVDFGADMRTPIYAARGGVVQNTEYRDKYSDKDPARPAGWPYHGNFIFIQHEDGTYGVYYHEDYNGIYVMSGQTVKRGDMIGAVGKTGYASGSHVHFGVATNEVSDGDSVRIRYEATVAAGPDPSFLFARYNPCYIPRSGDLIISTNG